VNNHSYGTFEVRIRQESAYEDFYYNGIIHIDDLFQENRIIPFKDWEDILGKEVFMRWRGLVDAVLEYKRENHLRFTNIHEESPIDADNIELNTKNVYNLFLKQKAGDVTVPKISKYLQPKNHDWKQFYTLPAKIVKDTKSKLFQFHILHNTLVNNYWLAKWNIKNEPCTLCQNDIETTWHLFWDCRKVQQLYGEFGHWWLCLTNLNFSLNEDNILLGNPQFSIIENISILELKKYIYMCRCREIKLNFRHFVGYLKTRYCIEREIAMNHNKVTKLTKYGVLWGSI